MRSKTVRQLQPIQQLAIFRFDHADEKAEVVFAGDVGEGGESCVDAARLGGRQGFEELAAFFGGKQQALAAIGGAGLLLDIAVIDQLPQDSGEALLGDLEDVQQVGDRHAGLQIDEIQHPVVSAAKALAFKQCV